MTVLSVSIVFTVVEPVFLIRQSAKCANRAVLCRPVIVRPPHFPPKRPGHALGATLGRHEERQHPRPAGRHRFTRVQEARSVWRFGDRMEGADRAGHLQLDLVLLVDPARVLPLIQLWDNAAPDLLGVGPDVLFDNGDAAVLGDGDNDRGVVRARRGRLRRLEPLAVVQELQGAAVDKVVAELKDVAGLNGIEHDPIAPVVVGVLRERAIVPGRFAAQVPEQFIHQAEAIDAVLAGHRLAAHHLLGGGLEFGVQIFVTHNRISCA